MIRKPKFMNVNTLKDNYRKACDAYLQRFCELIEMDMHYADWVDVGGVAEIGDYYVSMQDMMTAVEHNIGYEQFIKWYDYTLRAGALSLPTPNLDAWLRGCPRYSEETLLGIEAAQTRVRDERAEKSGIVLMTQEELDESIQIGEIIETDKGEKLKCISKQDGVPLFERV